MYAKDCIKNDELQQCAWHRSGGILLLGMCTSPFSTISSQNYRISSLVSVYNVCFDMRRVVGLVFIVRVLFTNFNNPLYIYMYIAAFSLL